MPERKKRPSSNQLKPLVLDNRVLRPRIRMSVSELAAGLAALEGLAVRVEDLVLLLDKLLRVPRRRRLDEEVERVWTAWRVEAVEAVQDVIAAALAADEGWRRGGGREVAEVAVSFVDLGLGVELGAEEARGVVPVAAHLDEVGGALGVVAHAGRGAPLTMRLGWVVGEGWKALTRSTSNVGGAWLAGSRC